MVTINGIEMGSGIPKICIPIVEVREEDIINEASRISQANCDVVKWRIDFYESVFDLLKVRKILPKIKETVGEKKILLVTFRTKSEGGQKDISLECYEQLIETVVESGYADLVDIELFIGESIFKRLVKKAKSNGCFVIASNHDFSQTPECEEMVARLLKMYELGADISKIAVMPQSMEDVTELLRATAIMKDKHNEVTVVTMSMGKMGMISRIAGEVFGSAMTFGILDKPSAPGQVELGRLQEIMKNINEL